MKTKILLLIHKWHKFDFGLRNQGNNKYKNNKDINPHGNFVKKPTWLFLQEFFQNLKDQKFLKTFYIVITKHIRFKKLLFW